MSIHNEAKLEDIEKVVIMPGDPMRAKYIAENFLENAKLVNTVRAMYAYTGTYKGKKVTVMAHGMGIPSIGIYAYELYKFYDVDCIIRIGSCGANNTNTDLLDTILVEKSYTESNFAYSLNNEHVQESYATKEINDLIKKVAEENNLQCKNANAFCAEVFDPYLPDIEIFRSRIPKDVDVIEMEAFALFYIAKVLNKKSACLLTVVDSLYKQQKLSSEDRQNSLNNMIKLALESAIRI